MSLSSFSSSTKLDSKLSEVAHSQLDRPSESLPLVSVIIPAYNAENFIAETLESVLAQTYQKIEVVIIDDGSSDRTAEIIEEFSARDSRIVAIYQKNAGVVATRNRALGLAKGELIAPLDADDIWLPDNLERQVDCMLQSDSSIGVVYSWSFDIDEQSKPTGDFHAFTIGGDVYGTLLCHCFLSNASCSLIRKTCLEKSGLYRTKKELAQGCEDWDLYLRLAEVTQFCAVPKFLVGYRKHTKSMTNNSEVMARFLSLIWESTLEKYPKMPKLIYRISTSSFFQYLGWQSAVSGQSKKSLMWLYRSVKIGTMLPLLRPDFYIILIKVIVRRTKKFKSNLLGNKTQNTLSAQAKQYSERVALELMEGNLDRATNQIFIPHERQWTVRVQILAGDLLHWFVSSFLGNRKAWKT